MEIRHGVSEEDGSNNYGLVWKFGLQSLSEKSQASKAVHSYHAMSHFYKSNYPHILIGSY